MKLFLIENDRSVDSFTSSGAYDRYRDAVVCFNHLAYLRMKKEGAGHNFIFIEELFTPEDYKELHGACDRIAFNWYKIKGADITLFDGVSYGEAIKYNLSRRYMMSVLLKYGEAIRKAVERWPAVSTIAYDFSNHHNSFYCWGDDGGKFFNKQKLAEEVAAQLNRKSLLIVPDSFIPSISVGYHFEKSSGGIKKIVRDTLENALHYMNLIPLLLTKDRKKAYFYSQANIESMLEYEPGMVIASSFCLRSISDLNKFLKYRFLKFENIRRGLKKKEKLFLSGLRQKMLTDELIKRSAADFVFKGIDYTDIYRPAIADLVLRVIPDLMKYILKVRKGIRKYSICKIIVNEELEEKNRAAIEACRMEGIKSILVDHGIQGHQHAHTTCERSESDIVICPGTFFIDHYQRQGRPDRLCIALGNPVMDTYCGNNTRRIDSIKDVLFLDFNDTFYSRLDRFVYQEQYFEKIFFIFNDLIDMGIRVHLKPHPHANKEYYRYLLDFFKIDISRIDYIEKSSFASIIHGMDLVVSNLTTCFYEAQAAGIPTIFFEPNFIPGSLLPPLSGIDREEVIRISNGDELLNMIKENRDDPGYLVNFRSNFIQKYASSYIGKLDGMAGKRIIDFLRDESFGVKA